MNIDNISREEKYTQIRLYVRMFSAGLGAAYGVFLGFYFTEAFFSQEGFTGVMGIFPVPLRLFAPGVFIIFMHAVLIISFVGCCVGDDISFIFLLWLRGMILEFFPACVIGSLGSGFLVRFSCLHKVNLLNPTEYFFSLVMFAAAVVGFILGIYYGMYLKRQWRSDSDLKA